MIAKLIVHGKNRQDAIDKLKRAISEYKIEGVKTTLPFGTFVLNHTAFTTGNFDTKFVENYFHPNELNDIELQLATILTAKLFNENNATAEWEEKGNLNQASNWTIRNH